MNRFYQASFRALSLTCVLVLLFFPAGALLFAQAPQEAPPAQLLSPEQLDTLVAPIALYPDSLLSQVMVAATYPVEVVEASQWLQQNRGLQGYALVNAAQQQNWDTSIQALVVFPDVLNRLASNIRWTTDLGNAFLAQQADVMNAVQRMRAEAQANGRLYSNAQETVTTQDQGGQTVIEIAPANPEVVYVPAYDPAYIWGPPAWGYYPPLYYPAYGFGFGSGIYIGGFFGGLGWGGWGWGPNWFNCTIVERPYFFGHYGFRGFHDFHDYRGGGAIWVHNPEHRLGTPYANPVVANRFGGGGRFGNSRFDGSRTSGFGRAPAGGFANSPQRSYGNSNPAGGGWRRFGEPGNGRQPGVAPNRQGFAPPSVNRGGGSWSRFGEPGSQRAYRPAPSFAGGGGRMPASTATAWGGRSVPNYRSAPAFGGGPRAAVPSAPNWGSRSMPSYRPAPAFGGGGYRSAPSFSAPSRPAPSFGGGGFRSAPSFGGGGFRGNGGGGGFRGGAGGGGFHGGGGGGGSHGGGGGGRRR